MLYSADSTTHDSAKEASIKATVTPIERRVKKFSFESKRIERRKQNKPLYDYVPYILQNWTYDDFKVHHRSLLRLRKRVGEERKPFPERKKKPALKLGERAVEVLMDVEKFRLLKRAEQRNDRWFIVPDTKAYMHDPDFFDRMLTQGYPELRMKVAYEVMHDLVALTARRDVYLKMPARRAFNLLREGGLPPKKMVLFQDALEAEDLFDVPEAITDSFINCCMHLAKHYYFVIVISDDPARRKRASARGFPSFDLKSARICVQSIGNLDTNLRITVAAPPPSPDNQAQELPQLPTIPMYSYWLNNTLMGYPNNVGVPQHASSSSST